MENRKRNRRFLVSLTEKEMNEFMTQVRKTGMTRDAYVRTLIKGSQPKELPPVEYFDVLKILRQISNSLNQLAMIANSKGFIDTSEYWKNVDLLQIEIGQMMEAMYS